MRTEHLVRRDSGNVDRLEAKVKAAVERGEYGGSRRSLVVAVSGGADSLALLHSLLNVMDMARGRLHVAHLDHDFRGREAEEDARFVSQVARDLGLPATVEKGDAAAYQKEAGLSSFEEAAREVRYTFLTRVAKDVGASAVSTGHTADDLAETVLMHILRGSGVHGLRGMAEHSKWRSRGGVTEGLLFRPLLEVTKADTETYCRQRGIVYRNDTGNLAPRFTRNRVRHRLLPSLQEYNPRVREALLRLARSAALEVDYLEAEVERLWPSVAVREGNSVALNTAGLASLHPLMRRLVLRRAYQELAGDTRRLEEVHLEAMEGLPSGPSGRALDLPRGLRMHRAYGQTVLATGAGVPCPYPPLAGRHQIHVPTPDGEAVTDIPGWRVGVTIPPPRPSAPAGAGAFEARFDLEALGGGLSVRTRQPGDRFQPLGLGFEKKLQDFFVDQKVSREWRDRVPLLVSERGIAWVVGYRMAEWARAREDSRRVCEVRFLLSASS